ncbi:MAG TPA: acetylglutamate kinase [Terriglobia bacterium]|nr:acetylglutamate kinase [Terriglobia bacterium]
MVIKIGGSAAESPEIRKGLAKQIVKLCRSGHDVVVVHGGGKLLTQTLERLGLGVEFQDGLRVTDRQTRDVALMVLAGIANKQWVAAFQSQKQAAIGICGGDAGLVSIRPFKQRGEAGGKSLGFVGLPNKVDTAILELAFRERLLPVVASVAPGPGGEYYNVNADDFAAALAAALRADRLLFLTESGGVLDQEKRILPILKVKDIPRLIQDGTVRDGMIPKLLSCARILDSEIGEIDILSPAVRDGLLRIVAGRQPVAKNSSGTRVVKN